MTLLNQQLTVEPNKSERKYIEKYLVSRKIWNKLDLSKKIPDSDEKCREKRVADGRSAGENEEAAAAADNLLGLGADRRVDKVLSCEETSLLHMILLEDS